MINNAVVRYIGHFENAVKLAGLECLDDMKIDFSILRSSFRFPVGHGVIVPASRLPKELNVKVENCTAHLSLRSSLRVFKSLQFRGFAGRRLPGGWRS